MHPLFGTNRRTVQEDLQFIFSTKTRNPTKSPTNFYRR